MRAVLARLGTSSGLHRASLPSRAPLRVWFSTSEHLGPNNYKEKLAQGRKHLGTSTVYLHWDDEKGEDDFLQSRLFAESPAFENVAHVRLDAPHLPLDGRCIKVLGEGKPLLKRLSIEAWTFHSAEQGMWSGFQQLHTLDIDLSDGRYFPGCFNDVLRGVPATLKARVRVKHHGPHYGALDCSLLPRAKEVWMEGLTLHNPWRLPAGACKMDCKNGGRFN